MTTQQQLSTVDKPRVTVMGAGYAGLLAALRLAPHARVTLVDPADHFTERVRLHERAAARTDITHPLAGLLRDTGIRHLTHRATALDPAARTVTTDDGQVLLYDRLVYALGSRTNTPAPSPTAPAPAPLGRLYTAESAGALCRRMRGGRGSVAVVGGGLTGIEMAAELAETYPDWSVRLLSAGPVAAGHPTRSRTHIHKALSDLGVRVEEGTAVPGPEAVDADAVVWSASMVPNTGLAAAAGLVLDPATGRIAVDAGLRSVSHPEIYAAGDAAAAHSAAAGALRMGCATALPTGSRAASSIISGIRGDQPGPLKFTYVVQCVSLGRRDGVIQFVRGDDSPRSRSLTGRPAARFKEQIVRSTIRTLRLARRAPGLIPAFPGMS
ncbi:NAD(P)/FAD-dependent oxidoreductase [Streptomyces qinzhouensis]|uniref:Pyridine nucleotide-disulfide oxidoreductase n=1 Tax=Streptomyces qinzhouensis TaxID=2599401 RepID=A0A5B8JAE2_9ACTN|nr:FAD-dependent oxidoreductase [Streptomyces qinzhouensis]QDY78347.1 pyridine nucleotide-disulfide oxidoreductase [Streptomyces qinzhouensis]